MNDIYGIRHRIQTARHHATGGDEHALVYAALELRFCMEAVAYGQLAVYSEEIRSLLSKEWNPSKIIKTLVLFDERSDQTSEFSISVNPPADLEERIQSGSNEWTEGLDFLLIGNSYRIPWKKFGSAYSTLGSFLHLGKSGANLYPKQAKLDQIIAMLEEVANSTVIAALNDIRVGTCLCGGVLVVGQSHQLGNEPIRCGNGRCNAIYMAKPDMPGTMFLVDQVTLLCPCGANVPFARERMLAIETCPECRTPVRARINKYAAAATTTT
ncbi:hypothetical protein JY406_07890 [Stenotrophomonas maltophilia]|nr:hypothetical protein [Stenotrophomonas maltophilia]